MKDTMRAVVKNKPEPGVSITDVPVPEAKKDEVLIKVIKASICGTDIGIYDWGDWAKGHITPPIVIGHEVVGEILEINSDDPRDLKIGDLVSSETHIYCGQCYQCGVGNAHICENMKLFGISRDGAFAEYATLPIATTWKNDPTIPVDQMSVQEPLGNAVNVVTTANVPGKRVLIYGLGPTGLCAAAVAKAYGAHVVTGIDPSKFRQNLGKEMGCDETFDAVSKERLGSFDIVLEMSGNKQATEEAFEAARLCGTIIAFGIPKEKICIDWGKYMINKELTIKSIFGRMIWDTWHRTSDLLLSKKVDLGKIITHELKLEEFEKAMEIMKSGEAGKIILTP
ncbi:alcohol dehydrogenase catalytic domain-containing protein [Patescibacteria group bacterium]|nr:alcohol dehydrogenase catalytic domain-containing protein [Patescibacteria group bacterium]